MWNNQGGKMLFDLFWRTKMPDIKDKISIMRQIAKGVAFHHNKNIVHRDIKPGNVRHDRCLSTEK